MVEALGAGVGDTAGSPPKVGAGVGELVGPNGSEAIASTSKAGKGGNHPYLYHRTGWSLPVSHEVTCSKVLVTIDN